MFKKHKFQQTKYPTHLDENQFYEHFDEPFRKILKKHKLTKEFIALLEQLYKKGWGGDDLVKSLKKDQGIKDILEWISRLSYSGVIHDYKITTFEKIGDLTIGRILDEYINK